MKDIAKAVLDLQIALERNGVNAGSLEITLSHGEFQNFDHRYRYSSDCFGIVPPGMLATIVGVPFKARPLTLKERTDRVCAKMAGGHVRLKERTAQ
jgi:hypothetical protein